MTEVRGERIVLRPIGPDDVPALRAIRDTPEVAAWWGKTEDDFPLGDEPSATRHVVLLDGEVIGMVQFIEEKEPDYRHAEIDIFLDPRHLGRGLGTDAVATLVRHLQEDRGHHRAIICPAAANAAAIRSYEKAGFRRVGVLEASWRNWATGRWEDELLMELVVRPAKG
jgi:aminoglycoside 6'-N-acetyltransferase